MLRMEKNNILKCTAHNVELILLKVVFCIYLQLLQYMYAGSGFETLPKAKETKYIIFSYPTVTVGLSAMRT